MALLFTPHARKRILERGIGMDLILGALSKGIVVEEYADDTPYLSRLVLGFADGRPLHLVLAGPRQRARLSS